jgi:hypothetical protein
MNITKKELDERIKRIDENKENILEAMYNLAYHLFERQGEASVEDRIYNGCEEFDEYIIDYAATYDINDGYDSNGEKLSDEKIINNEKLLKIIIKDLTDF